jgi:hypothetical protein
MRRFNTLLLIPAVWVGVALAAPPAIDEWTEANAIPLATVKGENDFADLQPLKRIVGDARIVSLGEATHGTLASFCLSGCFSNPTSCGQALAGALDRSAAPRVFL